MEKPKTPFFQTSRNALEPSNLRNRFLRLYETAEWSDCSFIIDGTIIDAHRLVLATSSPVFEVMLYGPMAHKDTIPITDMGINEFKQLLGFIYTDVVKIESIDNAWCLLYAAKKYFLHVLQQQCSEFIINNLSAATVLISYELANLFDEHTIQNTCIDMLKKYTPEVLNCDYHVGAQTLTTILDQNTMNVSEWDLICAAIEWSEDECKYRDIQITQKNRRAVLQEAGAMSKLRFMTLPVEYLNHAVLSKILSDTEIYVLQHINKINDPVTAKDNMLFDFNSEKRQRFRVALPFYTATRWILKGAMILRINSLNTTVKTFVTANRRVLVSSFTLPTRLVPRWITHSNNEANNVYLEVFTVSVTNSRTKTKVIPDTNIRTTVPNSSSLQVKLSEPVTFDSGVPYQIEIIWPFENYDFNGYEYSLDCLSTYAERKGTRFVCISEYDLIQSISYSPYSM
ncbi:BTB/POZ domain-containing protein 2-like [Chrysoperla carnea]|uniref:BTB/POZ domain-containing protein 2-like n=1 Tax=Chrysoperla carnea TaxID=189513 RepID=UPI001D094660|nr:BTB/POZ domain-containing protein 2-like [Chrysoperla carnea]